MEKLITLQKKEISITSSEKIQLNEQVIFHTGQEGKRIWESGIVLARYFYHHKDDFQDYTVLDLGSGTGITALTLLKYSLIQKIIMTDYTEEMLDLLRQNTQLQKVKSSGEPEIKLVDWTDSNTYHNIGDFQDIDLIIATDVIYKGSPYDKLAFLIHEICKASKQRLEVKIMIPSQREKREDFLDHMKGFGFEWSIEELKDEKYIIKALDDEKESNKFYPGLKSLNFELFTFMLKL